MATVVCVLKHNHAHYFWAGFYLVDESGRALTIGPYQGTLGCLKIPFGKGVCGVSAESGETIIVPDVHAFPGHIACDSRSESEIVVPFRSKSGELLGVFDVDSTEKESFDATDQLWLETILCEFFSV